MYHLGQLDTLARRMINRREFVRDTVLSSKRATSTFVARSVFDHKRATFMTKRLVAASVDSAFATTTAAEASNESGGSRCSALLAKLGYDLGPRDTWAAGCKYRLFR